MTGCMQRRIDSEPGTHLVIACRGDGGTALERRPVPAPGAGEILLKLRVVGFCGTDLFKLRTNTASAGAVLGHEVVGAVIAVGPEVTRFHEGDRVVVPHHVPCGECWLCRQGSETMCEAFRENLMDPGGFAERILIRRRAVEFAAHKVADHLSDEAAVFLEPAACVLRGIDRSGLPKKGTAAVLGAGSMGLLHLLVLRAAMPGVTVAMVDPDSSRLTLASRLGAAATAEPGEAALAAARDISACLGVDAVFDTVGGEKALAAGISLTRPGGAVVLFAHAPADQPAAIDLNALFKSERRVIATYSGALREQRKIFDLLESGALDPWPLVTHRLPLEKFEEGMRLAVERKALKVLFTPPGEPSA
jgi:L-iditol 2-dehydrogenase